ncbi:MAG: metallophosphoesterase [Sedimentisphaerales bacterium]|nr:metallophosphoesterase [Sedimentisphaerales bacterium]
MSNANEIIATLEKATELNFSNPFRQGNIIRLPATGKVVATGDLHGNDKNFDKIVKYADLASDKSNHIILHELIHDPNYPNPYECHSYCLIYRAAQLLIQYPGQIHYILGNHAMAQITAEEVIKAGKPMVKSLNKGFEAAFGADAKSVYAAFELFFLSLALVVKTANGVWISHSLPDAGHFAHFNYDVFITPLTIDILKNNQSVRSLLWDRRHDNQLINEMAKAVKVDSFIVGHQPQAEGSSNPFEKLIILASDHNKGCILPFDLSKKYTTDELYQNIIKIMRLA